MSNFCFIQGQVLKTSVAHLHPNVSWVPLPPPRGGCTVRTARNLCVILTSGHVCWNIRNVKLKFYFFPEMRLCLLMLLLLINAVCFLFLLLNDGQKTRVCASYLHINVHRRVFYIEIRRNLYIPLYSAVRLWAHVRNSRAGDRRSVNNLLALKQNPDHYDCCFEQKRKAPNWKECLKIWTSLGWRKFISGTLLW